jgi:cholesterol transport system auxiliary component
MNPPIHPKPHRPIRRMGATRVRGLVAGLLFASLAGACGPLVQIGPQDAPPHALLNLSAAAPAQPQVAPRPDATLLVDTPTVPGLLQTVRVPVVTRDTQIAYLVGSRWVEHPAELFQGVLSDVLSWRSGATVMDPESYDLQARFRLGGSLQSFGLDVRDVAQPAVTVRYDAVLSRMDGTLIGTRRFEAREPVPSQDAATVAAALNATANRMAVEVADWVAGRLQ